MTPAELTELRKIMDEDGQYPPSPPHWMIRALLAHCDALAADRDRILAENARLREAMEQALVRMAPARPANLIVRDGMDELVATIDEGKTP
jgi:hypothetical protein